MFYLSPVLVFCAVLVLQIAAVPTPAGNVTASAPFDRFFVIILENTDLDEALQSPFMGQILRQKGRWLSNYKALTHPSQPNYIGMIAGDTCGVRGDGDYNIPSSTPTLVDRLESAGISWKTYQENYPGNCYTGSSAANGLYKRKHNPFISFGSISGNRDRCNLIVNADVLQEDIQKGSVPQYVFYTPNMDNDGHDTSYKFADKWLKGFLSPLLDSPVFSRTLFLVTFDENESTGGRKEANPVYAALIGPGATAGSVDEQSYTHYSQISTLVKYWGLESLTSLQANSPAFDLTN